MSVPVEAAVISRSFQMDIGLSALGHLGWHLVFEWRSESKERRLEIANLATTTLSQVIFVTLSFVNLLQETKAQSRLDPLRYLVGYFIYDTIQGLRQSSKSYATLAHHLLSSATLLTLPIDPRVRYDALLTVFALELTNPLLNGSKLYKLLSGRRSRWLFSSAVLVYPLARFGLTNYGFWCYYRDAAEVGPLHWATFLGLNTLTLAWYSQLVSLWHH